MGVPKRYVLIPILLLLSGVAFAWGATLIINLNNSATVVIPNKNYAVEILPAGSTCQVYGSPVYNHSTNSTIAVNWGSINEPGNTSLLFCLENVGTASSATFTQGSVTPSPGPGQLIINPQGAVIIAATSVTPLTVVLSVTTGAPAATYQFSLTIS